MLLALPSAEDEPVSCKKLAAEDEEQDNARNHLRGVIVQVVLGRDLDRAFFQEHQKPRHQHHHEGVELRKPRHDDGRKPAAPAVLVDIVCDAPATAIYPASPHTAPESIMVRITTA